MTKRCPTCGEHKPHEAFYRNRSASDGLQTYCKPCHKGWVARHPENRNPHKRRLWRYGLTVEQFDAMVSAQGGRCAGCLMLLLPGRGQHIDHCHASGRVRGVLCRNCNHALGQVRDSQATLRRLAEYLEVWE